MKIAVVGSRNFYDFPFLRMTVENYFMKIYRFKRPIFVSGGARGADKDAENFIDFYNQNLEEKIQKEIYLPDWDKFGKGAGFIRNRTIIENADLVVAFWNGESKGTKNDIDLAIKMGKPIDIYIRY